MRQTQRGKSIYGHHPRILRAPLAPAVVVWQRVSGVGSTGVNLTSNTEPGPCRLQCVWLSTDKGLQGPVVFTEKLTQWTQ